MNMQSGVLRIGLLSVALATFAGCAGQQQKLQQVYDAYWQERLERSPLWSTYIGDHRHDAEIDDLSVEAAASWDASVRRYLARVEAARTSRLSPREALDLAIFKSQLQDALFSYEAKEYLMPLVGRRAPQFQFPLIPFYHPFADAQDYRNYIARLNAFPRQVEQSIAASQSGMEAGYVASKDAVQRILPQIEAQLVADPKQSHFYQPAMQFPETVGEADRQTLAASIAESIENSVEPAFRRLLAFVENDYLPACREELGVSSLPNGDAIYARLIRVHADSQLSPDAIHELGLREVEHVRMEMDQVRQELGFEGSMSDFSEHMRKDKTHRAQDADALLSLTREVMHRARQNSAELFAQMPSAECEVRAVPADRAAASPAMYYSPAAQSPLEPAYLNVNTFRVRVLPTYTVPAFVHRESYPGRHMQATLATESSPPEFRRHRRFDAFIEGWTLYADNLAFERFEHELAERYGHLLLAGAEAARLVIDTGIHHLGWTRDEAIAFMEDNTALADADIAAEVDQQITWPAMGLAPALGSLKFVILRRSAEATLGEQFDIRAFHEALLSEGAMPMPILERRMQDWLQAQTRRGER